VATHLRVVAVLFIVVGAMVALIALFSSFFFGALAVIAGASGDEGSGVGAAILGLTGAAFTVAMLLFAVPAIVAGWGLTRRRRWARILAIVLAAIALLEFPAGTIFGAYALWVLFNRETESLFPAVQSGSAL
jgi:hypothetical protein